MLAAIAAQDDQRVLPSSVPGMLDPQTSDDVSSHPLERVGLHPCMGCKDRFDQGGYTNIPLCAYWMTTYIFKQKYTHGKTRST